MAPLSDDFTLTVRQGPERAKVAGPKEKERKPVDPPPIVQLEIKDPQDMAHVNLCEADLSIPNPEPLASQDVLSGTLVSSLHRLKDVDNTGKPSAALVLTPTDRCSRWRILCLRRSVGQDRRELPSPLQLVRDGQVGRGSACKRARCLTVSAQDRSGVYQGRVLGPLFGKAFPGMSESTFLSRSFADQGVRLRIRKEPRTVL
ncbi:MAG: hypothetical protein Q9207_006973 [Kuettlingeria erythrocarpa]